MCEQTEIKRKYFNFAYVALYILLSVFKPIILKCIQPWGEVINCFLVQTESIKSLYALLLVRKLKQINKLKKLRLI